jgi:APA family basic amino acid/polyamine antiporter
MADTGGHRYGVRTATLLVIASMVGTGVFTTTGLLLEHIESPAAVLLVWLIGGLAALSGALSYAELASALPKSGGEYALLSHVFHPSIGFCAGFISIIAGFAAPIAACALAFARYTAAVWPGVPELPVAIAIVLVVSLIHATHLKTGARFQDVMTVSKIGLILLFLIGGLANLEWSRLAPPEDLGAVMLSPSFAVGLVLVYFAYTGWNAAAYIAGEVEHPARTLPIAFSIGTLVVTGLYLSLNAVFLAAAPRASLSGRIEIGAIAAEHLFGASASRWLSVIIAVGLVSTIGALVVTGTRVYEAMGQDHPRFSIFAKRSANGAPTPALAVQALLAISLVLTASFDLLLGAVGFALSIASGLTVAGLFVERWRNPERVARYRVPFYPLTPLFFIGVMVWTVIQSILYARGIAAFGLIIVLIGFTGYFISNRKPSNFRVNVP